MIVLKGVTQHYGVRPVLRQVDLRIPSGRLTAIVGPNGIGKTTLLGVIAGILSPQKGYVEINGLRRRRTEDEEIATFRRNANARQRPSDPGNHEMLRLWPLRQLHVDTRESVLQRGDYRLLSLLAGLFVYTIFTGAPESKDSEWVVRFLCLAIGAAAAGGRLIGYCQFHHPPISLLGRANTRQWIIPDYDVVFVAPLLALICGIVLPTILLACGVLPSVAFGTTVAVALWIAWLGGPDKRRWQLTSPCRIVHFGAERKAIEEI